MLASKNFAPLIKDTPAEAEVISHQLLLRSGMIRKVASGIYNWLPLGFKTLKLVENIVREEMTNTESQEIFMPMVQPRDLWEDSKRWDKFGPELLRFKDRHERDFCLGPTHEEIITDLIRNNLSSYKELPLSLFQIQTKFRDEIRPRYGIMRGREFLMKDAYSFHLNQECLNNTYQTIREAYKAIFNRLGLGYKIVKADSGAIGGEISEEFHVLAESGEDTLAFSEESEIAINAELLINENESIDSLQGKTFPDSQEEIKLAKGIEVGHIFQLGNVYSSAMNATVLDENGNRQALQMGCYGIGVSRIVAAAIEQNHDDKGIIWPKNIAPIQISILPIFKESSDNTFIFAEKLYKDLSKLGLRVMLDDRQERFGKKITESELVGSSYAVVIGKSYTENKTIELISRNGDKTELKDSEIEKFLIKAFQ
ncbi:MAG: proline--tRNA ligase [Gammaproteobacteria bacterium]|jgi:prolyl-tRNA synthetase